MRNHAPAALFLGLALAVCAPVAQAAVLPSDVGTVTATSAVVDVPVYIRDTSGTPVGVDQPPVQPICKILVRTAKSRRSAVTIPPLSRSIPSPEPAIERGPS